MTQPGYRHDILVIDRSGSMSKILDGSQEGLSAFLASEAEQQPGKLTVSLWDFDDVIRCVHSLAPVSHVLEYQIAPRNGTALYDAIGRAVAAEGEKLAAMPEDERPSDVTLVILTDGLNNASVEYTRNMVRGILEHQQSVYSWRVMYLGANQDAMAEGASIGIPVASSITYAASNATAGKVFKSASSALFRSRASGQSVSYTGEERGAAWGSQHTESK